jgi:hypothetical protein
MKEIVIPELTIADEVARNGPFKKAGCAKALDVKIVGFCSDSKHSLNERDSVRTVQPRKMCVTAMQAQTIAIAPSTRRATLIRLVRATGLAPAGCMPVTAAMAATMTANPSHASQVISSPQAIRAPSAGDLFHPD